MRKTISFLILAFLFTKTIFSQVTVKDKTIHYSFSNQFDCYSFDYTVTCPYFDFIDSTDFVSILNDSIGSLFFSSANQWKGEINFDLQNTGADCSGPNGTETMILDYAVTTNSKSILSFTINDSWEAGQGGNGAYGGVTCFTIDMKTRAYLNIDSFFNPKNKLIVLKLFEQQMNQPPDTADPWSPKYIGMTINDTVMMTYYTYIATGSKQFYNQYSIPLKDLKKYMTKRAIKLLFSEADKPKKK